MTSATMPITPFLPPRRHGRVGGLGSYLWKEATGARSMATSGVTLWSDGDQQIGIWECGPGPSRWLLETNEFVHIVAGRMTVTVDKGEAVVLAAGDTAVFPKGWSGDVGDRRDDPQALRHLLVGR